MLQTLLLSLFFASGCLAPERRFFIITGGPGAGKTALIEELKKRGYCCVEEVARKVIKDEMNSGGDGVPWKNLERCIELMVRGAIETYKEALRCEDKVIVFDRGVLDYLNFAARTGTPLSKELEEAARLLRYHERVFIAPPWEAIYCNDTERKQSFEEAQEVYRVLVDEYSKHGYEIVEIPMGSIEKRADFVIDQIRESIR